MVEDKGRKGSESESVNLLPFNYGSVQSKSKAKLKRRSTPWVRGGLLDGPSLSETEANPSIQWLRDRKKGMPNEEAYVSALLYVKAAVYGGLDGVLSSFATVAGVAGAGLPNSILLILGIAHLVADGFSIGAEDMMNTAAEIELWKRERSRQMRKNDSRLEEATEQMVELYHKKGLSKEDAAVVVHTLAKYKHVFLDIIMLEAKELIPARDNPPSLGGIITFASFCLFGCIPLFCYVVNLFPGVKISHDVLFATSSTLMLVTVFLLGAVKGALFGQTWWKSAFMMVMTGTVTGILAWVVGYLLKKGGIDSIG